MNKTTLGFLLFASSLFGVKQEKNPYFTCRTGKLMIINDTDQLLSIFVNRKTQNPSHRQIRPDEVTQFETDKHTDQITLELKLFIHARTIVLKGRALKEDPTTSILVSFLYPEKQ